MTLLLALLLAQVQPLNTNESPVLCMDEGAYCRADKRRAFEINCSGAGVSCAQTGGRMTLTVSGGGGSGGGAPVDGGYVVLPGFTSGSTNERTLSAGQYTSIDTGTAGQVQVDWTHGLTCSAGQALTSSGTTAMACTSTLTASDVACVGACVGDAEIAAVSAAKVSGTVAAATTCSVAESADYLNLVCSAGQYVTCDGASCSCSTPAAGGSSGPLPAFGGF